MKHLFIAGCPRSGTTVLARLLNLHPDVVIGMERYKSLYSRTRDILPGMLEPEGFFNFQSGETSYVPGSNAEASRFYDEAKRKFATARFVGDKYPQFFRFYGRIFERFPGARFVFIVRNPVSVAQSWQRRADDSTSWPQKNDARRSIGYWNDALAYTLAYTRIKPGAFVFVEFETLFRLKMEMLTALLRGIDADVSETVLAEIARRAEPEFVRSEEVLGRPVTLAEEVTKAVRDAAEWQLYEEARKVAQDKLVNGGSD